MMEPGIEARQNLKWIARASLKRSRLAQTLGNVHACKRKSAGNAEEHIGKFAGNAMKDVVNSAGNMQQYMNTMKIFKIFISRFPENLNMHRNTN